MKIIIFVHNALANDYFWKLSSMHKNRQ